MENNEVGITVVGALLIAAAIVAVILMVRYLKNQTDSSK
jgi:hypothetical protein